MLAGGGHLADLRFEKDDCPNLLWTPPWKGIDPHQFNPDLDAETYGGGSEARLLSGIRGHNLCFPFWGDPTPTEYVAGATFHGESNVVNWHRDSDDAEVLRISAVLPQSQMTFRRDIRVEGESVFVECVAENLTCWDKAVVWCEHATFGPPLLSASDCLFEASLGQGFLTGQEGGDLFRWPQGKDGTQEFDLTEYSDACPHELANSFAVTSGEVSAFFPRNESQARHIARIHVFANGFPLAERLGALQRAHANTGHGVQQHAAARHNESPRQEFAGDGSSCLRLARCARHIEETLHHSRVQDLSSGSATCGLS